MDNYHLKTEISTFEANRYRLEAEHMGEYVVIRETEILGLFPDCDSAARSALQQCSAEEPFLLRQIGRNYACLSPAAMLGRCGAGPFEETS